MLTRRGAHAVVRSRNPAARAVAALAAIALAPLAGCHTGDNPGSTSTAGGDSTPAAGPLKCIAVSSAQVAVAPPVVEVRDDVMHITGTVHRQPGTAGILDGRVDVDLIGPDGLMLDKSLHCPLSPNTVPADPNSVATYAPTPFGYVPPAGSTLRARYVDRQTAILENLRDGDLDVNGNGGHTGNDVPRSQENGSMPTNPSGGSGM